MANSNTGSNSPHVPPGSNMSGMNSNNPNMNQSMQHQIQAMQAQMQQQMAIMQRQQAQIQTQRAQLAASHPGGGPGGGLGNNLHPNPLSSSTSGNSSNPVGMGGLMSPQTSLQHGQGVNSWSHPGTSSSSASSSVGPGAAMNMSMSNLSNDMMHAANAVAGSQSSSVGLPGSNSGGGSASGGGADSSAPSGMLMQQLQYQQQQQQRAGSLPNPQAGNVSGGLSTSPSLAAATAAHRGSATSLSGSAAVAAAAAGGANPNPMALQNMTQLQRQMSASNASLSRRMSGTTVGGSLGLGMGGLSQPSSQTSLHNQPGSSAGVMVQGLSRSGSEGSNQNQQFLGMLGPGQQQQQQGSSLGGNVPMNANMMQLQQQQQLLAMQNAQAQGQHLNRVQQPPQQQQTGNNALSGSNASGIASLRSSFSSGQANSASMVSGTGMDGANAVNSNVTPRSSFTSYGGGNPVAANVATVAGQRGSFSAPPHPQSSLSQSQMLTLLNQQQQAGGSGGQFPNVPQPQQGAMGMGGGYGVGVFPPGPSGRSSSITGSSQKSGSTAGTAGAEFSQNQSSGLPDFAGGWQSNADLPERRSVIVNIVKIIERMRPDANKMSNRLPLMAKKLEEHLYRSASTKAEYVDPTTLKKRLQFIAHRLGLARNSSSSVAGSLSREVSVGSASDIGAGATSSKSSADDSSVKRAKDSTTGTGGRGSKSRQRKSSKSDKSTSGPAREGPHPLAATGGNASPQPAAGLKPPNLSVVVSGGMAGGELSGSAGAGPSSQQNLPPTSAAAAAVMKMNLLQNQLAQQQTLLQRAAQSCGGNPQQKTQNEALLHQLQAKQSQLQALMNSYSNVSGQGPSKGSATAQHQAHLQSMQKVEQSLNLNAQHGGTAPSQQQALSELQKNMQQAHHQQQQSQPQQGGLLPNVPQLPSMAGMLENDKSKSSQGRTQGSFSSNGDQAQSAAADPQRQKVIKQQQQRLLLLRHASKCTAGPGCHHKLCPEMTKVWHHIRLCRDKNCETAHCLSSRCVLHHYRICKLEKTTSTCEVCAPVMQQIKLSSEGQKRGSSSSSGSSKPSSLSTSGMVAGKGGNDEEVDLMEQLAKEHAIQDAADAVAAASGPNANVMGGRGSVSSTGSRMGSFQGMQHMLPGNTSLSYQMQMQALLQQQQGQQGVSSHAMAGPGTNLGTNGQQTASGGNPVGGPMALLSERQGRQGAQGQPHGPGQAGQGGMHGTQQPGLSVPLSQHQQQQQQVLLQQLQVQQQKYLMQLQRKSVGSQQQGQQTDTGGDGQQQLGFGAPNEDVGLKADPRAQPASVDAAVNAGKPKKRRSGSITRKRKSVTEPGGKGGKRLSTGKGKRLSKVKRDVDKTDDGMSDCIPPLPMSPEPAKFDDEPKTSDSVKGPEGSSDSGAVGEAPFPQAMVTSADRSMSSEGIKEGAADGTSLPVDVSSSGTPGAPVEQAKAAPKVESAGGTTSAVASVQSATAEAAADTAVPMQSSSSSNADIQAKKQHAGSSSATATNKEVSLVSTMSTEAIEQHLDSLHDSLHLTPRRISQKCVPIVNKLINDPYGWVFKDPVDPVELGIPDYFDVVETPMDLGLVKSRLENGLYKSLEGFEKDTKLVFENCILYNGEDSDVGEMAKDLLTLFNKEFKVLLKGMKTEQKQQQRKGDICSLCGCSRKQFEPTVLYCNGACGMQRIRRNATYYADPCKMNHWCVQCYGLLKDSDPILLDDGNEVRKKDLQKLKNDALAEEGWVECDECHSWVHQICALFNGRKNKTAASYCCPKCHIKQRENGPQVKSIQGAKDLPHSTMSRALEEGLMKALRRAYEVKAKEKNCSVDEIEKADGLYIRVVSNMEKRHVVRDEMYSRYRKLDFPSEFPVRSKCILLFQSIHGVDVLLFGMYVYEYDHDCPAPNRRRVYISYLDSVHYFHPRQYRTLTYHTILVEYLRFVKERGFHTAHIWSCPPSKGDDYVFYCHPSQQKIPRGDMLVAWYHGMLDIAKEQGIVLRTRSLYDEYFRPDGLVTGAEETPADPTCLPYFEGDYVPGEVENIIKDLNKEEEDRRKENESLAPKARASSGKPAGNKKGTRSNPGELVNVGPDKVMLRLGQALSNMRENFIVAHLRSRAFAAAVERGDDVSNWLEDDDEELKDKARNSGKDASILGDRPRKTFFSDPGKRGSSMEDLVPETEGSCKTEADPTKISGGESKEPGKRGSSMEDLVPETEGSCKTEADPTKISGGESKEQKAESSGTADQTAPLSECTGKKAEDETSPASVDDKVNGPAVPSSDASKKCGEGEKKAQTDGGTGDGNVDASSTTSKNGELGDEPSDGTDPVWTRSKAKPVHAVESEKMNKACTTLSSYVHVSGDNVSSESSLQAKKSKKVIASTADQDPPQESEFFDSRQQFLNYCTANHFQFDELRRAKHTTIMILFHLHNPAAPKFLQQCGSCYREITHGIRYHCNDCSNFDLCHECYEPVVSGLWAQRDSRFAHDKKHTFTPVDMEATSDTQKSREERAKSIKLHLDLLQHCASCAGAPACSSQNCSRMRGLFTHLKTCKLTYRNGCKVCSRFLALLSMHARKCTVRYSEQCPIPYCDPIRERNHRLRQQQQLMDDRRRNAQNELYRTGRTESSTKS